MLLKLYHRMPGGVRSLAASARGYQLRRWRYGTETDRLVAAALERESWTPAQWDSWRKERLSTVLIRAAQRVPHYRKAWEHRGGGRGGDDYLELAKWPLLNNEVVRSNPRDFLADDCDPRRLARSSTSGSTGKPMTLWCGRAADREWYALFEARCRHWYGVSRHDSWAIMGGQLVVSVGQQRPPFWVWNAALHQLYLSVYHIAPQFVRAYVDALKRHRITYLLGYTSALDSLAAGMIEANIQPLAMKVVLTNAEPVLPSQRQRIERAFGCPVRETYGMAEMTVGASECEYGILHLWPEPGVLELAAGDQVRPGATFGEVIVTGLLNPDMPLIRYRVGDTLTLEADSSACRCGRTLPRIRSIEGRTDDLLFTEDGRRIGRLDPVFKGDLPLQEAQIVQTEIGRVSLRYVPAVGFDAGSEREIRARLSDRMGKVEVVFERVDRIERGPNGKFKSVVCLVKPPRTSG